MADNDTQETPEAADETAVATTPEAESKDEEFSFVEDPEFDVDYKGDCAYEVKVTIPAANEEQQAKELFDELSHEAELPGFRKGRAPRRLLEKKFAKHVKREVEEKLVTAALEKLVKDKDLRPMGDLDIDGLDDTAAREKDAPLTFTLKFEVGPRVELGKYRGIEVERPVLKVEEEDIEETIKDLRSRYAVYESLEEGTAEEGDQVIIDFNGTIAGEEFPGGKAENYPYILGTKRFFAEFEEVLSGSAPGSELSCEVKFPEDYSNKALRGKTATFIIKVNEIKRRDLPELSDEFAKQVGYTNVAHLREKVADELRERAMAQSNWVASSRAIESVIENSAFEFPKSLVESMTQEGHEAAVKRLRDMRVPEAEIREREPILRKEAEAQAIKSIKSLVTLNEVADVEGVEVTDEDLEKEAADIGGRFGVSAEIVANVINEKERRSAYELRILRQKASAVLMEHAIITDKEVPFEELEKELDTREASNDT